MGSFNDEYSELRKKRLEEEDEEQEEQDLPLYRSNDIAPVGNPFNSAYSAAVESGNRGYIPSLPAPSSTKDTSGFFQSSDAFDDGYDFGDVSLTILGTAGDLVTDIAYGATGVVEGITDLLLYGASGVADLVGADEVSEDLKSTAIKSQADDLFGAGREAMNKNSILGDTGDAVGEGIGQALLMIATLGGSGVASAAGKVGTTLISSAITGTSGMGRGMSEAYQGDATDDEAVKYGAMTGLIEAGSELIFGGMGKTINAVGYSTGLSSLDDIVAKKISSKISSTFWSNMAEFGVKSSFEGAEELLAGFGDVAAKKLTYMSEEDISKLIEDENLLESFVVGTITSGIMQSGYVPGTKQGSLKEANSQGKDFITGYTSNEQAVIDKEIANRIAEAEADGEKLTNKQKADIREKVFEDIEKGYISTDVIESVLGGEDYSNYQNELKRQQDIDNELKELRNMKSGDMTDIQIERMAELKAMKPNTEMLNTLKYGIDEKIRNALTTDGTKLKDRGSFLAESYNEQTRRGQAYEADLSQYDSKQAEVVKKAIESKILNNTRRTHDFVDMVAKISADKGVLFDFTNNAKLKESGFAVDGKFVNGYVTKDGITVNMDSAKYVNTVVGHEITHVLEGTDFYNELQNTLFEYAKSKGEYQSRLDTLTKLYEGVKDADVNAELTADLVGDYLFTDSKFISHLSTTKRNVFQKIYDEIKYLYKMATAGSKEARQLEKVKRAFDKVYRESGKTEGTKYSLDMVEAVKPTSNKWVQGATTDEVRAAHPTLYAVDEDATEQRNPTQVKGTVNSYRKIYDALEQEGFDGTILDASSGLGYGTKAGIEEYGFDVEDIEPYPDSDYKPKYTDYSSLNKTYDVVISNAVLNVIPQDQRDALVVKMGELLNDGGRMFINVRGKDVLNASGKIAINEANMEYFIPRTAKTGSYQKGFTKPELVAYLQDALGDGYTVEPTNMFGAVSAIVTKDGNTKYSLSDSDGKKLTKEQSEYFKDSKMRDENGNLKVMYHGTRDAGFHEFNQNFSDDDTSFFFVDRNDVAATYSGTYETYEAKAFRTVEDANKFFAEINKTEYEVIEKDGEYTLLDDGDEVATSDSLDEIYREFCDYEGVGYGDANYKVYLNLTNPLVIDAEGRNWNNITREYSQEIADRYHSLTAEEKAALTNLAEWGEYSIFKDEMLDARAAAEQGVSSGFGDVEFTKTLARAYAKLGGANANLYDAFSIASDNFSEDSIKEFAVKQMNTRDYAKKAKAEGYDGVIFKNIHDNGGYSNGSEGASTVAIAFESNQIKSVANDKPTGNKDIRYSLSDSEGAELSKEQQEYFKDSKIRNENGSLKVMHHGSPETFTVFDKSKAKSSGTYGKGFYFTDSTSHAATYGKSYDVYLNITNPLQNGTNDITKEQIRKFVEALAENEDYGIDNYGYDATIDSVTDSVWGKSDFGMILDLNISCVGNMVEAIELFNEVNGTDYNGIVAPTETVAFYPNQIKSIDNKAPTADKDIRFSLSEAVEETSDLIAIHNLQSSELPKALALGGMPMPSIAVIKAQQSHESYGDVSLIFPKDTIDPQKNRANKVYGGDAWTPTYPSIEYKASEKAQKAIKSKIDNLVPYEVRRGLANLALDYDNISNDLNRHNGDLYQAYRNNDAMQYAFLVDNGFTGQLPTTQAELDGSGRFNNDLIIDVVEKLGAAEVERFANGSIDDSLIANLMDMANENAKKKYAGNNELLAVLRNRPLYTEKNFGFAQADSIIRAAYRYVQNGIEQTVDYKKATDFLRDTVDVDKYKQWLDGLFADIVEKEGIRNNADYFTPSGNRRSWEALHWENTLENVLKVMKAQDQTGQGFFGGASIFGVANKNYRSIAEVKADSKRLQTIPEEEYDSLKESFSNRLVEIATSIKDPNERNRFIAIDNAVEEIVDAVRANKTKSGILQYMQKWNKRVTETTVEDIVSLVTDISNMPTGYFEAKPQRAVGFDEVGVFVIPNNADTKLKQELLNRGYSIAEYDPNVEGDRQKVVNSFEEYKFSLSDVNEKQKRYGDLHISGEDVKLQTPVNIAPEAENIAPITENMQETETEQVDYPEGFAPIENSYTIEQELAEIEKEIDALVEESTKLYGKGEEAKAMELLERINELSENSKRLRERANTLKAQEEADNKVYMDSLTDADVPTEAERAYDSEADTSPLDDKTLKILTRSVRNILSCMPRENKAIREVIEKYSTSGQSKSELFNELKKNFGDKYEFRRYKEIAEIKKHIRNTKFNVTDRIKGDITDYKDFRKGSKVKTSKKANYVDTLYQELSELYPGMFPSDIWNETDQYLRINEVMNTPSSEWVKIAELSDNEILQAADFIYNEVNRYKNNAARKAAEANARAYIDDIAPSRASEITENVSDPTLNYQGIHRETKIKTVKERLAEKLSNVEKELADNKRLRADSIVDFNREIARLQEEYSAKENKNTKAANNILRRIERLQTMKNNVDADYEKRLSDLEARKAKISEEARTGQSATEQAVMRAELHLSKIEHIRDKFAEKGLDFDEVLKKAKNLSTLATVDNTPQRVMEKALGYKEGQILADETVNKVAQNETEGIKWLNSYTDRKNGLLAQISRQYNIKPGTKESAAAQMYAEGFYVKDNEIIKYGDDELAMDFPDTTVRANIKGLANDPRIRKIYDDTLDMINESRARNAYPEIQKLDNYFLHFRAMDDTFSRLGLPFNPNDIKAKDLPTDLNGVTADLKPGQPYFASSMHREGLKTSFDLLGGLERYLSSAKNQIYHIDDIQTLRALRNHIANTYGQANGLDGLDALSEEEVQERIKQVFGSHLSTFAKFLNEEANVIAGKTALIDRGLEGVIGRRGMTFMNTLNKQVGANMVGFNVSSSMTNFLPIVQAFAKTNKTAFVKGFAQTVYNKLGSIAGKTDGFAESSPVVIRRKGADRFYRTPFQKIGDAGYVLMSAVDNISTEIIARAKYNELTAKGMSADQAHVETDKWVSRLMGDRSLGQMPQLYNSKMLGLITKFQLEVRNQLDSQFYDTIQETKADNADIENTLKRNSKTAAKVALVFTELAIAQHLFGKAFESIAGYNPAFDIIDVLIKAFGWDDDEESEDTALDNIEQGFLTLLEDLPYTSTLTGGRIPLSNALPITELITGEDEYGNEVDRLALLGETAPYYILPGGYGQAKKTIQGLSMFSDEHPIAGSYTDSGNLRFPVDDTLANRVQAGIFGQWASDNARDYFNNERAPLKEKQIQEFIDVGMTIQDYWKYREGLSQYNTLAEKADYIYSLDLTDEQKNVLINNIADRKEDIDMSDYGNYGSFEEFDYASKYPEKYAFWKQNGISYEDYASGDDDTKAAYNWAYENPDKFTLSKVVASDVVTYRQYTKALNDLKADKDEDGKSITGSRKEKVIDYVNNLDADYGSRIILFKSEYPADDTYNYDIIDYLNSREDISYKEMETILKELGFTVDSDGNIYWD